jgi:hypothetical protein
VFCSVCTEIGALIERGTFNPNSARCDLTKRINALRGAATLYLAIVGVVFPLLLSSPWTSVRAGFPFKRASI